MEFNTDTCCQKSRLFTDRLTDTLILFNLAFVVYSLLLLFSSLCIDKPYHVQTHPSLYINCKTRRASLLFSLECNCTMFVCVWVTGGERGRGMVGGEMGVEKLSIRMPCRVLMISSEEGDGEREGKTIKWTEKVSSATLLSLLFIVIEINRSAWWLIVDADDRAQLFTKQVTLWLLLVDYACTTFCKTTVKCIAVCVCGQHSIDYAYSFHFVCLFSLTFFFLLLVFIHSF
jgi:hypothetical protein